MTVNECATLEQLLHALDAAGDDDSREATYASTLVAVDREEIYTKSRGRPCAKWLGPRLSATPPGQGLPAYDDALPRILEGRKDASAADAYVVLHGQSLPPTAGLHALQNALVASIRASGIFPQQVVSWYVRAAYAVGQGQETWALLDHILKPGAPAAEPLLKVVTAMRGRPELSDHPVVIDWFRTYWRGAAPAAIPALPPPPRPSASLDTEEAIALLRDGGAEEMAQAIADHWARQRSKQSMEAQPLVRAFRDAAGAGRIWIPVEHPVPDGMRDWILSEMNARRFPVALLAVRSLVHAGAVPVGFISMVVPDTRASDLPLFREMFVDAAPSVRSLMDTIESLCSRLQGDAADAAAFLFMPNKISNPDRFADALVHIDEIYAACHDAPEQRGLLDALRAPGSAGDPTAAARRQTAHAWFADVKTRLDQLRDRSTLDEPTLHRVLAACPWPDDKPEYLDTVWARSQEVDDLQLALLGAFGVAERATGELRSHALFASIAIIGRLGGVALMPLRLRLIRTLRAHGLTLAIGSAELRFLEARTLFLLDRPEDAEALMHQAAEESRLARDLQLEVNTTLDWSDIVGQLSQRRGHWVPPDRETVMEALERLLDRPLRPEDRGRVLGHIFRRLDSAQDREKARARQVEIVEELREIHGRVEPSGRAAISSNLAEALLNHGEEAEVIAVVQRALDEELPAVHHSEGLRSHLYLLLAKARLNALDFDLAMEAIEAGTQAARRFGNPDIVSMMEWEGSLAIHRKVGVKYYRLPFLTRAREAAEQIPDSVRICQFGLEEARCAREPWEAAPGLRSVKANMQGIMAEERRSHVEKWYHIYRERHGLPDPPDFVPVPLSREAPRHRKPDLSTDEALSLDERIASYFGFVPTQPGDPPESTVGVLQDRCAAAGRSGDIGAYLTNALTLLDATRHLGTAERVDEVASSVIESLDEVVNLFDLIDPFMRGMSLACIGVADRMARGRDVIEGAEAERVVHWIIRSLASTQRRRLEREQRPDSVSLGTWAAWRESLRYGLPPMVHEALQQVRQEHPSFMTASFDPEPLGDELGQNGLLVGVVRLPDTPLDVLLGQVVRTEHLAFLIDRPSGWRYRVVRLGPTMWPTLEKVSAPSTADLDRRDRWAREALLGPLEELVGTWPDRLLWCPKGPAEVAAPSILWPSASRLTMCSSPSLPRLAAGVRGRTTLITYADPGEASDRGFGAEGMAGLLFLLEAAQQTGLSKVQLLAGVGDAQGREIDWPFEHSRGLVEAPPSPRDFMQRQMQHDLIVVVAHGTSDGGEDAAIDLLGYHGETVQLGADTILRSSNAFAGASILLLSCYAGRGGALLHRPAGFAGACLAAGAREVVAPLRAVSLLAAISIAVPLVHRFVQGARLSDALAEVQRSTPTLASGGPMLGPIRDEDGRKEVMSFVSWVG